MPKPVDINMLRPIFQQVYNQEFLLQIAIPSNSQQNYSSDSSNEHDEANSWTYNQTIYSNILIQILKGTVFYILV